MNTSSTDWCLVNVSSSQWSRPRCSSNVTGDCHPHSPPWSSERDLACSLPVAPSFSPSQLPALHLTKTDRCQVHQIYLTPMYKHDSSLTLSAAVTLTCPCQHVTWTVSPFPPYLPQAPSGLFLGSGFCQEVPRNQLDPHFAHWILALRGDGCEDPALPAGWVFLPFPLAPAEAAHRPETQPACRVRPRPQLQLLESPLLVAQT